VSTPEGDAGRSVDTMAEVPAVGVYPTAIGFEQTVRGGEYFRTIGVMNGSDSEQTFTFTVGGQAAPWLAIVDTQDRTRVLESVVAPPRGEARVFLRVRVPPDLPNGAYAGQVQVLTSLARAAASEGAGASVSVGAEVGVIFGVTGEQKIAGSLIDVAASDVEVGSPLDLRTTVQNSGNVQVTPQIELSVVDPQGAVVGGATFADEMVYPGETKVVTARWDTTGQRLGERVARVRVKFGDVDLGVQEARFNILAVGTLSRRGELEGLELQGKPAVGGVAKVIGDFRNTGQIDTRARLLAEVYRGSTLTQAANSEERLVERGATAPLELFVDVPTSGTYSVRAKVNFEGKETDVRELTFTVGGNGLPLWPIVGGLALAVIVAGGVGWGWRRRLARR